MVWLIQYMEENKSNEKRRDEIGRPERMWLESSSHLWEAEASVVQEIEWESSTYKEGSGDGPDGDWFHVNQLGEHFGNEVKCI